MSKKLDDNQIIDIKTNKVETFEDILSSYFCSIKVSDTTSEKWSTNFKVWNLSQLFLLKVKLEEGIIATAQPLENDFLLEVPSQGKLELGYKNNFMPFIYNSNHLMTNNEPVLYKYGKNAEHIGLRISQDILQTYALKFTNYQLDCPEKIKSNVLYTTQESLGIKNYLQFIAHQLSTPRRAVFQSPLIAAEIQNTILSMLISLSNNNNFFLENQQNETCLPSYVKVATDYIDAHLSKPISLADLASITEVHASTLINGFRKHYNISPLAYLKCKRLEAARRDLLDADPKITSVTDIATTWGFFHLSRFAQYYQNHFGELPSETLKKNGSLSKGNIIYLIN